MSLFIGVKYLYTYIKTFHHHMGSFHPGVEGVENEDGVSPLQQTRGLWSVVNLSPFARRLKTCRIEK